MAEANAGSQRGVKIPDLILRHWDADFLRRVEEVADDAGRALAVAVADHLIGDRPTETEA